MAENIVGTLKPTDAQRKHDQLNKAPRASKSFYLFPLTPAETGTIIRNLKPKRSLDIDGLSMHFIKQHAQHLAGPLTDIINTCFKSGKIPAKMKIARVVPIHKSGCKSMPTNYRPISILPVFSKVLESALLERLLNFFKSENLITDRQYGFCKGKSTGDAVFSLLDAAYEALENRKDCGVLLCDLSKAFDCMNHRMFYAKLEHYGIRGTPLDLVESYFQGRTQIVDTGSDRSTPSALSHGVAQGSLLGPIFFIMYINDLPYNVTGHCVLYADDTTVTEDGTGEELETKMIALRGQLTDWFNSNMLQLNNSKTEQLTISTRAATELHSVKFLGVMLDARLNWKSHCVYLQKKLCASVYAIRRIRAVVGFEAALTAYHALFHSRLTYCVTAWGGSCHVDLVFQQQKRALRAICCEGFDAGCRPLFRRLGVLTLFAAYLLEMLIRAKVEAPVLETRGAVTSRSLRSADDVDVPFHRLGTTAAQHQHLIYFNRLPASVRRLEMKPFRAIVRARLLSLAPYSIEEFFACSTF